MITINAASFLASLPTIILLLLRVHLIKLFFSKIKWINYDYCYILLNNIKLADNFLFDSKR